MSDPIPNISVLVPCFNEIDFIDAVVKDILEQDYPHEKTEVFFIDGGSTDGTLEKLFNYIKDYPNLKVLKNPDQYVPYGMNAGIRESKGDIIIRLDAHSAYPDDYFSKLVYWLDKKGADNVGGLWRIQARSTQPKALAIAAVLSHPLGAGNALFRIGVDVETEVETVPFGCYPRATFEKYGNYDERLWRNQDIELNKRIRRAGGSIWLIPSIYCIYYARDSFRKLWKNNFQNGYWAPLTTYFTGKSDSLSLRHFVPFGFATYILSFILACVFIDSSVMLLVFGVPVLLYLFLCLEAAFQICQKNRNWSMFLYVPLAFFVLHFSYGMGTWQGIAAVLGKMIKGDE